MERYFILALSLISVALAAYIAIININIKKVYLVMEDIRYGNLNRRFFLRIRNRLLIHLCKSMNSIMDCFQKTNEKNRYLEEARKRMVADISHDLRTPMTSMIGYIEALQNDNSMGEEEKKHYLAVACAKGQQLSQLLESFFEMSKLESDEVPVHLQKLDLAERVREIAASFYQDFMEEKLVPQIEIPDIPLFVWGEDLSLTRVLHNLVSNAVRYGKDGGTIGISVRDDIDRAWVYIWDNGKGIAEKDLQYIFERLYTAERSRNGKLRGNGLGLTIAKKLVERMNGEIGVSSIQGEKTIFSFYLPKYL